MWASLLSLLFFLALKKNGRLRVPVIYEIMGIDFLEHQTENSLYMPYFIEEFNKDLVKQYKNK